MLNIDLSFGINNIWSHDRDYQLECLSGIIENIRQIKDPNILRLHCGYLESEGAFFVHNHNYLKEHFGESIADPKLGIYNTQGECYLAGRLAIPIRMFNGAVHGFIGYSRKPDNYPEDLPFIKYLYPHKEVFNKGRFFYITSEEYKKAISDGYICIVDGIFDKIILQCLGINAVSLCGSNLTIWHERYLQFIKHKIVIADNDSAGRRLASYCKHVLDNCIELIQPDTGDIDSFLRTDLAVTQFVKCFSEIQHEGFLLSRRLPTQK